MKGQKLPALTDEGFLIQASDWSASVAEVLAMEESITLTAAHWEIIELLRDYYVTYDSSPAMRALVKFCKLRLGDDKGCSIYLLKLFPGSPAKLASKIAGLPKPANCL
ncbi:TusE/DsrC/DsvC family sulfur relay protein [Congregibacter sp.]|uniref:TusE/DsrC/DsvC family sulfur relay protein n=1 Tax=Congregibacter sp. TaxID=2744308 RepID=UPI003F6D7DB7